ncbi:mannose-6-phosphate isomerase type 1 [Melghirimyces profundicolus]|uniref:Mannose-6-phosphate isomerase n=1 Tax=Melghirimyces profundicolus TaxID=1242148 RepID=A0A2T6BW38_9BACL|nr:mannose-6-phosphate isomerase, class I [Melghirimyces profundicolus]PTX60281.1 mannose-6-phosphate isomerase type 1 [Melghirimyces profundicolus]
MKTPLFLEPVFKERIWGGTALRDRFGYRIPSERTGECWAISAHPHGPCKVKNGPFQGETLDRLWEEHRELFGNSGGDRFPLLTKILDANADLSVQVHPDDEYARKHENGEQGKTECWYIIDCEEDAELVFGHRAESREELEKRIRQGEWSSLLQRIKIRPGDFFYVPSGTLHALCAGTLVLETQQSSDTTYRVYDYDRRDAEGNTRELHIDKALDVITVPHRTVIPDRRIRKLGGVEWTTLIESRHFTVHRWRIDGEGELNQDQPFLLASVLKGSGELVTEAGRFPFRKGDHLILPTGLGRFRILGRGEWIVSHL